MGEPTRAGWILAEDAHFRLSKRMRSQERAEHRLLNVLRAGRLHARTELFVEEIDFGPIPKLTPTRLRETTTTTSRRAADKWPFLGPAFWSDDRLYEDWENSIFAVHGPPPSVLKRDAKSRHVTVVPNKRFVAYGVQFNLQGFEQLLTGDRARQSSTGNKSRYDWDKLLKPLADLAQRGTLDASHGPFDQYGKLQRLDNLIIQLSGCSETTAKRRRQELIDSDRVARSC